MGKLSEQRLPAVMDLPEYQLRFVERDAASYNRQRHPALGPATCPDGRLFCDWHCSILHGITLPTMFCTGRSR